MLTWINQGEDGCFQFASCGTVSKFIHGQGITIKNMAYLNPARSILAPMTLSILTKPTPRGCEVNIVQDGYQRGADWDWYYQAVTTGGQPLYSN